MYVCVCMYVCMYRHRVNYFDCNRADVIVNNCHRHEVLSRPGVVFTQRLQEVSAVLAFARRYATLLRLPVI